METGHCEPLSVSDKMSVLRRQLKESVDRLDERRGILHIRRHLAQHLYLRVFHILGISRIARLRAETLGELSAILDKIESEILIK